STSTFTVTAVRSGSEIQYLTMTAADSAFWLGGVTSSYCPETVTDCPAGNQTVLVDGVALDVEVPGGQQIYVNPLGALSYTVPHSAYIPANSSVGPFVYTPGAGWGHYTFTGWGASGFMACPTLDNKWQVFAAVQNATVPSGNVDDCLGFDALANVYDGDVAAWEYI
ncbi:hypothetical protein ASPZODRAFT_49437, partial [Penicilliopsis zonata CBS 506.65]